MVVTPNREPDVGTRLVFEHSGFDVSQPWGDQAFKSAEFGWAKMFKQLAAVVARALRPTANRSAAELSVALDRAGMALFET